MNGIIIFWAIAIGFAQIYIGVHYPLDILAGFVWGAFLAVGLFYVFKPGMEKNKGG
jgi:undecaprenyl-diphosphatase